MEKEMKVAVLIDAENISSKYANLILQEASNLGSVIYKRIYGNWTTPMLGSWKTELLENAIQPIQQYSNTVGKNSSDSSLIIDAMDLLYQKQLDAFCIVSSDSDFTRLASRLCESEMFVMGMGEQKTPRAFISACNKFVYLDLLYKAEPGETRKSSKRRRKPGKPEKTPDEKIITPPVVEPDNEDADLAHGDGSDILAVKEALRDVAEEFCSDDGWILSARLGAFLSKRLTDFDTRNFGFKKFVPFIESLNMFESRSISSPEDEGVKTIYFRLMEE